jgi:aspartokinase
LRSLSYEEASELAQAGAVILHPETMAPAQRLRIPITVRSASRPDGEGTRIGLTQAPCINAVKSIACKSNMTVIEIRSAKAEALPMEYSRALEDFCRERQRATLLAVADEAIYLAVESSSAEPGRDLNLDHCTRVRVRADQAIVTLVGDQLKRCNIVARLSTFLARGSALVLPQNGGSCSVRIVIDQRELSTMVDVLQRVFFSEVDPVFFAAVEPVAAPPEGKINRRTRTDREAQVFGMQRSRFA